MLCGLLLGACSAGPRASAASSAPEVDSSQGRGPPELHAPPSLAQTPASPSSAEATPALAQQLAPGVWVVRGAHGEVEQGNLGRIGNAGFIVGPLGVIAIDTGTSFRQGRALLAAIGGVTDRPVKLALLTHTRQEFLFGAAAFRERGIPVAMHAKAAQLMASRCGGCLERLRQTLGDDAMRGTEMLVPDQVFGSSLAPSSFGLSMGRLIGRPLQLLYFGPSSGPGDVALLDESSGVLFAGGLVDVQHIPDLLDADLKGWIDALAALRQWPIRTVVPGHGPAAGPESIATVASYLEQLQTRMKRLLKQGVALSEVADAADLPDFESWDGYATIHRRNASVVFLHFEYLQLLE